MATYGDADRHTWPLRRIEGLVQPHELEEHMEKELTKVSGLCCMWHSFTCMY